MCYERGPRRSGWYLLISVKRPSTQKPWDLPLGRCSRACTPGSVTERGSQAWTRRYGVGEPPVSECGLRHCPGGL